MRLSRHPEEKEGAGGHRGHLEEGKARKGYLQGHGGRHFNAFERTLILMPLFFIFGAYDTQGEASSGDSLSFKWPVCIQGSVSMGQRRDGKEIVDLFFWLDFLCLF